MLQRPARLPEKGFFFRPRLITLSRGQPFNWPWRPTTAPGTQRQAERIRTASWLAFLSGLTPRRRRRERKERQPCRRVIACLPALRNAFRAHPRVPGTVCACGKPCAGTARQKRQLFRYNHAWPGGCGQQGVVQGHVEYMGNRE